MALTKVNRGGLNTGISDSSDATFLTVTSGEGATFAGTLAVTGVHTVGNNAIYTSDGSAVTQNAVQSLVKCWVKSANNASPNDSFNVASGTDNGTGDYSYTFTNGMANVNYCTAGMNVDDQRRCQYRRSSATDHFRVRHWNEDGGYNDVDSCSMLSGDLA